MTTLDRAFIKAYAEEPAPVTAGHATKSTQPTGSPPRPSEPAWPSGMPSEGTMAAEPAALTSLPLSAYTQRGKADDSGRARHEIDRLQWPGECTALVKQSPVAWSAMVDRLVAHGVQGEKCIAFTALSRGAGCTTVCLTLARQLAERGLRPLVVEVNGEHPQLTTLCGLDACAGVNDVLLGQLPLDEALVASVDDGVTLMPWRGKPAKLADLAVSLRAEACFELLASRYDLILIDAPPVPSPAAMGELAALGEAIGLGAVYLVHDCRQGTTALPKACEAFAQAGLPVVGLIENFAATVTLDTSHAEQPAASQPPSASHL